MSTARIVVLTVALSAGATAYPASWSDNRPLPIETVSQLQGMGMPGHADARQVGTLSIARDDKSSKGRTI